MAMSDTALPEHEYLTVKELAELLRLKERKIYDLAASGEVPCSRATGKLLFPAAEVRHWIESAKSGGRTVAIRPAIFLGSHDPLLDWAVRQSRSGLATYFDGSLDGLERYIRGEGIAAGLHIRDARTGKWNVPAVAQVADTQNAVLIAFAHRRRGLVFRQDGPRVACMGDIAGLRFVPRQPESGTDALFRDAAQEAGVNLSGLAFAEVARTEDDAVQAVQRGEADVAFGLESVARVYGLDFMPQVDEEFALLVDRKAWFEPPFRQFLDFCQTSGFRDRAATMAGYDVSRFGEILWNA